MKKQYTLGLYEKAMPSFLSWKEKLETAKKYNYDFVEISIDETDEKLNRLNLSKEERKQLVETMYQVGVPIRTMCLSAHRKYPFGSQDKELEKKSMEIMEKAIELADDLGIRIIQLAGYDVYYEKSTEQTKIQFEQNLKKAVKIATKKGILLGFETMETEFMNTVEKAMTYVNKINSPYLGVYPDVGNITNAAYKYHTNVFEDIKKGKGHIVSAHLKETVPGKFREIPYTTGHVDFENTVQMLWELGVRRFVTEFWYTGSEHWQEDISFTSNYFHHLLKEQ